MHIKRETVNPQALFKELIPAIKDPQNILTKDINCTLTNTKMREALTALIISEVMNKVYEGKNVSWSICKNNIDEDPLDGYLKLTTREEEEYIELEQTMLTREESSETTKDILISQLIVDKIKGKHKKHYAQVGETVLVIFLDIDGQSTAQEIKEYLKSEKEFAFYLLILLSQKEGKYIYTVVDLDPEREGHSEYKFEIAKDFKSYKIRL